MAYELSDTDILDLANGTLAQMDSPRFGQIAQNLQDYEILGRWLTKEKVMFDHGTGIQRSLMTKLAGAARHTSLYETDEVRVVDLMTKINIGWKHCDTHWGFERRETLENRGKALLYKVMQPREIGAMIDLSEEIENRVWTLPAANDIKFPYGPPYWVVTSATEGFNGQNPSGHTSCGGIDASATAGSKWRNYTFTYGNYTRADLIRKWTKAYRLTGFKSPVNVPDFRNGKGDRYRFYANEAFCAEVEELAETRNDNLGWDLAPAETGRARSTDIGRIDGQITFKRNPICWVPKLDSLTVSTCYGLDHSKFYPVVLEGDYLRRSGVQKSPWQHNVFVNFIDLSYNFLCVDRRSQMVFYQS